MKIPDKLKRGDEVRIIAISRSLKLSWIKKDTIKIAERRIRDLGLIVTYGKHVNEIDKYDSSSIKSRINDLNEAFRDKRVKAIIAVIGGYSTIELLPHLNYNVVNKNPKIVLGYSDLTSILNAVCNKSNIITYYGPNFFDFGEKLNIEYTLDYFNKCLFEILLN